jgi:hypothetical protein
MKNIKLEVSATMHINSEFQDNGFIEFEMSDDATEKEIEDESDVQFQRWVQDIVYRSRFKTVSITAVNNKYRAEEFLIFFHQEAWPTATTFKILRDVTGLGLEMEREKSIVSYHFLKEKEPNWYKEIAIFINTVIEKCNNNIFHIQNVLSKNDTLFEVFKVDGFEEFEINYLEKIKKQRK